MLQEFKKFAMRGNVMDMAIGIILGTAFGKIISSFVKDVLMPPIGLLLGDVDFSNLFYNLSATEFPTLAAAQEAGAATINYGVFFNVVLDFLIVAFAIFLVVRQMNKLKKKDEPAPPPPTQNCPECLSAIPLEAKRCAFCTSSVAADS
jgi:large conductance mechanosensitive channel